MPRPSHRHRPHRRKNWCSRCCAAPRVRRLPTSGTRRRGRRIPSAASSAPWGRSSACRSNPRATRVASGCTASCKQKRRCARERRTRGEAASPGETAEKTPAPHRASQALAEARACVCGCPNLKLNLKLRRRVREIVQRLADLAGQHLVDLVAVRLGGQDGTDAIGDRQQMVAELAVEVEGNRSDYLPFGQEIPSTWNGRSNYQPDPSETLKFTGKERDAET